MVGGEILKTLKGYHATKMKHALLLLLLQFFFRFAQGQGPGDERQYFNISENVQSQTEVGYINVRFGYTYNFSQENQLGLQYFSLDSNTGRIVSRKIIDREALESHLRENKFDLLALGKNSDNTATDPVEISIEVLDENDNAPEFPKTEEAIKFRENSNKGTQQIIPTAKDADYGLNAVVTDYQIVDGDGPFRVQYDPEIYGEVLIIETTGKLDREMRGSYFLTIAASDKGTPPNTGSVKVNITIEDENDNQPVFDPSTYYARVNETDPVDTFVIQVVAVDRDKGTNQDITYQFVDENDYASQFRIENTTGAIFTTTGTLQCPKATCFVTVEARDGGVPSYTGRAFVYINIDDTNNHDPVLTIKYNPPGSAGFSSVNEDAKDGEIVAGITVTDSDSGANGQASVTIIAGNELKHFRMQSFGQLALIYVNGDQVLDRERNHIYNLTLEAKDGGSPPRTSVKALVVYVNDINDHAPVFRDKFSIVTILESFPVGSFVATMAAYDNDTGINAKLTYEIVSGIDTNKDWFHLNTETGLITTKSKLHYEIGNNFRMNISVHDGAVNPLYDYAELEIRILDENEPPVFSQTVFDVSLDENLGQTVVVAASATDYDSGKNGTVTYKFHDSIFAQYANTFDLDETTGTVTTTTSLDREQIASYLIYVIATDGGSFPLSSTATIRLKVNDVNDNSPVFYPNKYYASVLEGQENGIIITTVGAIDLDEGENGKVLYSLSGNGFGKFVVDETTGEIKTSGTLNKQLKNRYTLIVTARDKPGQGDDTATVEVSVISISDLIPAFTNGPYQFKIPEDLGDQGNNVGSNIGKVTATVDNAAPQIAYSIVDGDPDKIFTVGSSTGWLKRSKPIDRERYPSFVLKIVATAGDLFGETTVNVMVEDINDNSPVFDYPVIDIEILEDSPVGHHITRINAFDHDGPGPNSRLTYSVQRDPNNIFGIEHDTGLLFLNKPVKLLEASATKLDMFEVMVMDNGNPVFSAKQEVRVKVKDVNNNTPKFSHSTYEISLIESTDVNHQILKFEAVDEDFDDNGKVIYNITRGNEDKAFGVFPDGMLYVARELDRETKDLYKLSLVARDKGIEPRSSECNITVHIIDENDNKPIFINATYSLEVYENKPKGTFVGYVKALDSDMGRNAELSYYLDENQRDFKIDSQTGEITTLRSFDREKLFINGYTITFDVVVKDNGQKRLQDIATVRVIILDVNDNPPVFTQTVYKAYILENAAILSNVTVVKADDSDSGINGVVTYSVSAGNGDGRFKIGPTTGQITVNGMLDRETENGDFYELTVIATDSGKSVKHSASANIQIYIQDINDNYPLFAQTSFDVKIKEDEIPGKEVAYFSASDIDMGVNGDITYALHGKDNDGTFGIDSHTGNIYLLKPLDYERKQIYHMNVSATDNGQPSLSNSVSFNINIDDVNDNSPVFFNTPYRFNVVEHASGSINRVIANDADSDKNGEVQFHIAFQDPPGEHFKIVKSSGQLYIDKPIDREETDIFELRVVATDQAEDSGKRLSTEILVTIIVDDINDNSPEVISFNAIKVPFSTPKNEFITTIKARDLDTDVNGQISLQLIQNNVNKFGLESNSGRFYLSQNLSPTPVKYNLEVQASDYGQPSQRRTTIFGITVIITDDNEGLVFQETPYAQNILENSAVGENVLNVQAVSLKNSRVEYYITNITLGESGAEVGRYFHVNKQSGALTTAVVLDRERMGDTFVVEIYAIDVEGDRPRTSVTQATIKVLDENDTPPRFSQSFYTESIPEDVDLASTVATVAVTDDDTTGTLQLTISEGSEGNFRIHQDGSIVTTSTLDRERISQYTLKIMATDGVQSSFCFVRLNIDDVNDNAPLFGQTIYSFDVSEETPIGTTLGGVSAQDPDTDASGEVTYSLKSAWGNDTFHLDPVTGIFKLLRVLDFEETSLYTLRIKAEDNGSPVQSSEVLVYFNVKDANDNTPLFEPASYDSAVFENVTVGTSLLQVFATDIDSGDNGLVQYFIIDGDRNSQFRIDSNDGTIYSTSLLDREVTPAYNLVVMATDMAHSPSDRLSSTAEVLITLKDVNDYTPEFISPRVIYVMENTPQNTVVHTVLTKDLDEGANSQIEYRIISSNFPFSLGTVDGKLRVNTNLDRETIQNYTMVITATDKGEPALTATQTLVIKIEDDNDHSPVFDPASYNKQVREDVKIGTVLLQVSATDVDIGLNGVVRYYVIGGDKNFDFSLDQSSGVLRVQKNLDFERVRSYSLIIQAEDSGENKQYATTTVSISVLDVNDNTPVFLDSPYIGFVRENMDALPVYVLQVQAQDGDQNTQLHYRIREGAGEIFHMNSSTGEITALVTLNREQTAEYMLTVIATDSVTGRGLTGTGTVSIFVEDTNDNPPVFEHDGTYIAHITEESSMDTEVIVVTATDEDEGSNAQIIYSLTDTINDKFKILPTTGLISVAGRLDREDTDQYILEVVARDASAVPLSTTTMVMVYVDDINDNAPEFDRAEYTQRVLPSVTSGSFITGVTAIDTDIGDNGLVLYSLQQTVFFQIDSVTGVITATQSLAAGQTYHMVVQAEDKGNPPKSSSVSLMVEVLATTPGTVPVFNAVPSDLKVVENVDLDSTITTVTASSASGGSIKYYIAGGNTAQSFSIDEMTGRIYVSGVIDYEVVQQYHLWVEARQSETLSSFKEVVIRVEDKNDNWPRFTQTLYNVSIDEDASFRSPVETVQAEDLDSGENGHVTFSLAGPDAQAFRIDGGSGEITTYSSLDRETVALYSLTVIAIDNGSPKRTSTASVRVNIIDVNDNSPIFTRQFSIKIPENMGVGSFVLQVTSSDADTGINAVALYSLASTDGTFAIDAASGNITLQKPLNAEVKDSYTLRVTASDGAHDIEGNVEIEISDVNDNSPILHQPFFFDFPEQQPVGSFVGKLNATDADIKSPNNQIYFSLKLPSPFFDLDGESGEVTSLEVMEFSAADDNSLANRHELVVIAKDLGTPVRSSEETVYINIVDFNNHPPIFEKSSYFSAVPDHLPTDSSIFTVVARDEADFGQNAQVEYFLTGGNGSALFNVDRFSGIVSVSNSLSGKRGQDYLITIKAEDKGTVPQSSSVTIQFRITGRNNYAPVFVAPGTKQITIPEDKAVRSLIETFSATDSDTDLNAKVVYEISGGDPDSLFELNANTGKLVVGKELDYEKAHDYTLTITARDQALLHKETSILYLVKLSDVNDNDPMFLYESDEVFIMENSRIGTFIYQASAEDKDSGSFADIEYAIVDDPSGLQKFRINENTGIITSRGTLDYETKDSYTLTLLAMDSADASRKSTMRLTISLTGVNEYIPRFEQDSYYFSISESAEPNTSVGKVTATDHDSGEDGIVYYFLVGESNLKGFKINPRNGEIIVSGKPDYESSPRITLTVLAKNWGSVKGNDTSVCTVHISVQDANDPPVFTMQIYQARIPEGSGAGTSVLQVTAEDYDYEPTDRDFTYVILGGTGSYMFRINSQTGLIKTTGQGELDREMVPIYNITVGAVDSGSTPETGSATVQITLDDINDNGPEFMSFTAQVAENQNAGTFVISLREYTRDPDGPGNQHPYSYSLVPGSHMEYQYFDIGRQSGNVTTKTRLDREATQTFVVPVIVRDGGKPTMSSTLSFTVSVLDENDNAPTPRYLTAFVSLYEGRMPENAIANVKPADKDTTGTYQCNLVKANPIFSIAPSSCDLVLNGNQATETAYTLEVEGSDGSHPSVLYEVSVKVLLFHNKTLDNSIIIQVNDMTADNFLENSYTNFIHLVQKKFGSNDLVLLYGVSELADGDLLLFVAVRRDNNDYYNSNTVKAKIIEASNDIQSEAGLFIVTVDYSDCSSAACKNNGECISHVTVTSANQIADSPTQSLSSPSLVLMSYCQCLPQYTGPDCGQAATPCGDTYCQNGDCVNIGNVNTCQCPTTWTGKSCELDVNECDIGVCKNEARCENLQGSFICHCRDGFSGDFCEEGFDYCKNRSCERGTCTNRNDGFTCHCPYGYWGDLCQHSSSGFGEGSYMEFARLTELNNEIEVIFATNKQNALLLYNPASDTSSSVFIALEILDGKIRFSVNLGSGETTRVTINKQVANGNWYKVKVNRNNNMSRVWVEDCPADGGECEECQIGTACYGQGTRQTNHKLEIGSQPLTIGGVQDINTILNRTGQVMSHDFVGCVRSFVINGQDKLKELPQAQAGISDKCPRTSSKDVCQSWNCKNSGTCIREWSGPVCRCTSQYTGVKCEQEILPYGFSPDTMVTIKMRESYRRDQLIALAGTRRRRATSDSSVFIRFRTQKSQGLLLFTSVTGGSKYNVLAVVDGQLHFAVSQYGRISTLAISSSKVSDEEWHNGTVTITGTDVILNLDGNHEQKLALSTFAFTSLDVHQLSLGGASSSIMVSGKSLKDFHGCISKLKLDGADIPMNGSTGQFVVTATKGVENGCSDLCAGNPCDGRQCTVVGEARVCAAKDEEGPLSVGIIVVIVFFIVLIIVIIIVFLVFRYRKQHCMKGKKYASENGNTLCKSANSSGSHPDSGFGENRLDELYIRNHINQELNSTKIRQNGNLNRPDIIESDKIHHSPLPFEMVDGTVIIDNASDVTNLRDLNGDIPEHYDLENASSIAPSDIDVVDHYRHFHNPNRHRKKGSKPNSQHSSHQSHHSAHTRDNPGMLSSVPFMNDLTRGSPNPRQSPMNQLSRHSPNVRNSPLTHVNMHGMPVTDLNGGGGSRATSEHSLASHRSKNSSSAPHKPKRQMLPNGHPPNSNLNTAVPLKPLKHNYEKKQFLTLEEVDRLNSRPRESPASLMEAFSSSSENNTRKVKRPFQQYPDTSGLLEPPESSSEDSANDSFTCSEFEDDKPRNDFDPHHRIFSNLAEVENENDDAAYNNKSFRTDGLDSAGNSFSSNVVSSDEGQAKPSNMAFNWDDLLNWGPKFEKLVGVFTDIALLPDGEDGAFEETAGKLPDKEEYV